MGVSKDYTVSYDGHVIYSGSIRSCGIIYESISKVCSILSVANPPLVLTINNPVFRK